MPNRTRHPVWFLVTLLVGAPVAVLLSWPQAFGVQRALIVTQLLAFRAPLAFAFGAVAVMAVVVAVLRQRWAFAAGIAIVFGVASLANGVILVTRGSGGAVADGDLVVVTWNIHRDDVSPERIAQLVLETGADIVSLPETDAVTAEAAAQLVARVGHGMRSSTTYGETGESGLPTSLLIADDLGEYRIDDAAGSTPGLPSGVWRPVDGTGPIIVAAHPLPPLPSVMDDWRAGLDWVADQCDEPDVIVAGDLNATVDHLSGLRDGTGLVGDCRDAATTAGTAAIGTWPTWLPAWVASPIDHVLVGSAWTVRGVEVITSFDDAGSDHRPIVAVLDAR